MTKHYLFILLLLIGFKTCAQVVNTGITDNYDSVEVGKISIGGMVDTYYGFDFNQPAKSLRPYCVSAARHNEVTINLATIDLKYKNNFVRAHIVPGFGTYINDNYTNEKGTLKNLVEANVGVKISKKKDIWVDAGILGSPYTNESAISKDHLMYTRSFAPEFVPYYLAGVKLSVPVNDKVNFYGYLLNGWQQIQDNNNPLAFGTQLEYRPTNDVLINWDTYVGDEFASTTPSFRTRYFTDVYIIYKPKGNFSLTACAYAGIQETKDSLGIKKQLYWGQANAIGSYNFNARHSLSARIEYFSDPSSVFISPITSVKGFDAFSTGLCYNLKISNNALFRLEYRYFHSTKEVFLDSSNSPIPQDQLLITNLVVWF